MTRSTCNHCGGTLNTGGRCYSCYGDWPTRLDALPTSESRIESLGRLLSEKQAHIDRLTARVRELEADLDRFRQSRDMMTAERERLTKENVALRDLLEEVETWIPSYGEVREKAKDFLKRIDATLSPADGAA